MTTANLLFTALLSLLPVSELRGALPYAIEHHFPIALALVYCVGLNSLVAPLLYLFLNTINKLLLHFSWYAVLFEKIVERARHKVGKKVEKWGYLGIMFFVAIPLPVTGAYTGTLGAWVLGLKPKKTFLFVFLGVALAGVIVTTVWLSGGWLVSLFTNQYF